MTLIKLTPQELRDSAVKYINGSQSVHDVLSILRTEQEIIASNWSGTAFDSFEIQFNELAPNIEQFAQLLEDINQQLNSVANIIETTDADIVAQIPGLS
ncbi:WXG100 family type VII secretion target [Streptococcus caprae]|uniref:ESAT-6-like protein n=1 Tax=Streptococcus caprae TaxID=1640501 RepID=A0ABV8CWL4_9STRE